MNSDIIQHMERHFGPVQELALIEIVPSLEVAIHVIPPTSKRDSIILFTTGMSDEPQNVPEGREEYRYGLFMRLPADWPTDSESFDNPDHFWPFKWLRQIAGYPCQDDTWLGGPYTIIATARPPVPLAANTKLSCLLLLRERGEGHGRVRRQAQRDPLYDGSDLYRGAGSGVVQWDARVAHTLPRPRRVHGSRSEPCQRRPRPAAAPAASLRPTTFAAAIIPIDTSKTPR